MGHKEQDKTDQDLLLLFNTFLKCSLLTTFIFQIFSLTYRNGTPYLYRTQEDAALEFNLSFKYTLCLNSSMELLPTTVYKMQLTKTSGRC